MLQSQKSAGVHVTHGTLPYDSSVLIQESLAMLISLVPYKFKPIHRALARNFKVRVLFCNFLSYLFYPLPLIYWQYEVSNCL